jgi:hypothetical protein
MFLVHSVVAQEKAELDVRGLLPAGLAGVAGLLLALVMAVHLVPGGLHHIGVAALFGLALLSYIPLRLWPLEYTLTDTHLRVKRGSASVRWVPVDQIRTVAELAEDSEYLDYGFRALGKPRPIVIVNPELGDTHWVIFTPSQEFVKTLLWQIGRSSSALDPLPEGPPFIRSHVDETDDEDAE